MDERKDKSLYTGDNSRKNDEESIKRVSEPLYRTDILRDLEDSDTE